MSVTFSAVIQDILDFSKSTFSPEELDVNMSNSNAARVCRSLGLDLNELGWCGDLPAEDFLGRILVALAVEPSDAGVPATVDAAPGRATFIDCGRPEGYVQERLGHLRELADWAVAHGAKISFG